MSRTKVKILEMGKNKDSFHGAGRNQKTRVKSARGRRSSSTRWLQRQLNDPFVASARSAGFRSRAAWKLIQLDEKAQFLSHGARIVDLGAAPGGWSQVLSSRIKSGNIVAIDVLDIEPITGVQIIQGDVSERGISGKIVEALGGSPDIVLSDMAAPTTGHRQTDHLRTMNLCEMALDFAIENLNHGGTVVAKVFQGGTQSAMLAGIKPLFENIKHVKPAASRKESPETYLVAKGFKKKCS